MSATIRHADLPARTVRYLPMHDACALAPRADTAVISITNPGTMAALPPGWGALLRVQFSDAEYRPGDLGRRMADGSPFDPARRGFPTQQEAQAIRAFCAQVARTPALHHVLVHCHAGRRRSGAAALYVVDALGGTLSGEPPGDPNRTVLALLRDADWGQMPMVRRPWWARSWARFRRRWGTCA
ncbi:MULTISPECIES: tyrosine-protein phosphatase [Cupriavidus]